jgi:DNA-binding PadR family transcriptional regulator
VPKRRRVGNMLALAVLATVVQRPMHPYEMASILRERGKDQDMKIKWGSLYTVVDNLAKHGLLEATGSIREGGRPERTIYRLTDAGRAELEDWVRELLSTPEPEHTRFEAALSVVGTLPPDEAIGLLEVRLRLLESEQSRRRAALERDLREIPRLFLIEAEFDLALRDAEISWVRELLSQLTTETMPGVADWRAWHADGTVSPELAELAERGRPDSST